MTELDLDAIAKAYGKYHLELPASTPLSVVRVLQQVPYLIDEIRRLCADLDAVRALTGPDNESGMISEVALDAMLPLLKQQLVAEVRGGCVREVIAIHESHGAEAWCPVHKEHWPCMNELAAQLIERFEL